MASTQAATLVWLLAEVWAMERGISYLVSGDRSTSQHDDACAVPLSCDRANVNNCQTVGRGPVEWSCSVVFYM